MASLTVGTVVRVRVEDTFPPKIKRLIVVGIDADSVLLATVFINSEINPNVLSTDELKRLQLKLEATDRPYLDRDSYADCSDVRERKQSDIQSLLANDPTCHIGNVSAEDMRIVKGLIKSARTVSVRIKKKFSLFY